MSGQLLANSLPLLRQKICLLSLIDFVFSSASPGAAAASTASGSQGRRTFPFAAIAKATRLPAGEVEFLIMKALALGLIRGTMDQVEGTVTVTWVAPRVLDRVQVGDMAGRIEAWCARVKQVALRSCCLQVLRLACRYRDRYTRHRSPGGRPCP